MRKFDLLVIIKLWLEYVSKFWHLNIPPKILEIYRSIFELYLNHFDIMSWNIMESEEFGNAFRMMLLFLELECDIFEKREIR